ncbi:alpha/beta fold hydrolase [Halovenus halobia]|uniref:alpha/beta fold hydrolase n=1 Tax=Halovenus halobia TaxID=3396622 RepID=UPI003F5468DC
MYVTTDDGVDLYYETAGEGECVAFVGDCGFGAWQWAGQYDGLAGPYQTLAWDLRGTGRSDTPRGPYDVDRLASDLEEILADNSVRRVHVVGAGLGGMIALKYAREYGRAGSLSLVGTAPRGSDVDIEALRALHPGENATAAQFREASVGAFSQAFRESGAFEQILQWRVGDDHAERLDAQIAAVESFDAGPLYELTTPTLVFHGVEDPVVDPEVGRELAEKLPHGQFEAVEGRHLAHVEHARAVTDRLADFLDDHRSS